MEDPNGGIGLVYMLTACPRCSVGIDLQIRRIDFHFHLFHLGQNCHRHRGCMDTPRRFGFGDSLHTVNTAFKLEFGIGAVADDHKRYFLKSSQFGFVEINKFHFPAHRFGIHGIHTIQNRRKQSSFFPAGTAADFHDDVFIIIRIFGEKKDFQFFFGFRRFLFSIVQLFFRQRLQIRVGFIGQNSLSLFYFRNAFFQHSVFFHNGREVFMITHVFLIQFHIADHFGRGQLIGNFIVLFCCFLQFIQHILPH